MIIQHANFGSKSIVRPGWHIGYHTYGTHLHQFSELLYVVEGSIYSTVGKSCELVSAGQMSIITPLKPHSTYSHLPCKMFLCVFSNDFVLNFIPEEELYRGYERSVFTPSKELAAYIEAKLYDSTYTFSHTHTPQSYRTARACFGAIFDEYVASVEEEKRGVTNNALSSILLYIANHFREDISLAMISKSLGYTAGYISHCLAALPDMSFSDILNSLRIEHAKELIAARKISNVELAYECGFSSERTFYRAFAKHTGVTPKRYAELTAEERHSLSGMRNVDSLIKKRS